MKIIIAIFILILISCIAWKQFKWEEEHPCIKSHIEIYYSTEGTSLAVATKNYGFLTYNGYKKREVCDLRRGD